GEVNPTHAYYNGSCTIKDTEDSSWSTSFKIRRIRKTSSALEALWKTLFILYLYMIGTLLESSSTGSSFPADSAKPVPLAVVLLDSRQGHRIPLVYTSSELAVRKTGKALECAHSTVRPKDELWRPQLSPRELIKQSRRLPTISTVDASPGSQPKVFGWTVAPPYYRGLALALTNRVLGPADEGSHLSAPPIQRLRLLGPALRTLFQIYNRTAKPPDFQAGLFDSHRRY
ncbi:hypothetical protein Tco_0637798, partial [Tanacetum coccineum]